MKAYGGENLGCFDLSIVFHCYINKSKTDCLKIDICTKITFSSFIITKIEY